MSSLITTDASLRHALPRTFKFGAATAAYQIEGAHDRDGKGPSIWDAYLANSENGNDATRSYDLWREDLGLLKRYGVDTYRFSVSWPRVRPGGGATDPVNEKGIEYYSNLVDALLAEGITPFVTIFHWDLPLALDEAYGGFEDDRIVADFVAYAKVLFERLGDRVKNWITINEPFIYSMLNSMSMKKDGWSDAKWAKYTRSLLLCHAYTVDLYRRDFQPTQKGEIGITLNVDWVEPIDESPEAKAAAQASIDYLLGMYADPIYLGRFPKTCLERFGEEALTFSEEQWEVVRGSNEFFGLNHYGTSYATGRPLDATSADAKALAFGLHERVFEKDGVLIGNRGENGHPYDVPWGFRKLLQYIHKHYTGPTGQTIYITENGFAVEGESAMTIEQACDDTQRQAYFAGYIRELALAVKEGIDVGGYMAWSLLDNLEWTFGYGPRFGITAVDRSSPEFTRYPKKSALMLRGIFDHLVAK